MFHKLPQDVVDELVKVAKPSTRDFLLEDFSTTLMCDPMFTMQAKTTKLVRAELPSSATNEEHVRAVLRLGIKVFVDERGNYSA